MSAAATERGPREDRGVAVALPSTGSVTAMSTQYLLTIVACAVLTIVVATPAVLVPWLLDRAPSGKGHEAQRTQSASAQPQRQDHSTAA